VFIGYVNKTTKQYKVYVLDLQMTTRSSVVNFEEETKGKTVDLNLLREHLQGTPNVLTVHKPVGRPKELLLLVVELPPREKLNNFEIVIPSRTPETQLTDAPTSPPSKESEPTRPANLSKS